MGIRCPAHWGSAFLQALENHYCVAEMGEACIRVLRRVSEHPVKVNHPWFALRVRHRCEHCSASALLHAEFTVCSPAYVSERRWSDRIKRVELPLFPGYIFCQVAPEQRYKVLAAPGVVQIVGIGNTPVPVQPQEMEGVLRSMQHGLRAEPAEMPRPEDRVLIQSGPFRGLEGVVVELKKSKRIILLMTLLQRAIAVEVEESAVLLMGARPRLPIWNNSVSSDLSCT